jgi:Na+-transporting methylmalonyl-CoA/oxaloacetate decarboxylase gamma subunit
MIARWFAGLIPLTRLILLTICAAAPCATAYGDSPQVQPYRFAWTPEQILGDKGLPLVLAGMLVVFVALWVVATIVAILPELLAWGDRLVPTSSETGQPQPSSEPDDLAVLAVAVVAAHHRAVHRS